MPQCYKDFTVLYETMFLALIHLVSIITLSTISNVAMISRLLQGIHKVI